MTSNDASLSLNELNGTKDKLQWKQSNCNTKAYATHVLWLIEAGSDNGLSPDQWQTIIWTNAGMVWIGPWETNFNEIVIKVQKFSLKEMIWKCCLENVVYFVLASMCSIKVKFINMWNKYVLSKTKQADCPFNIVFKSAS